MRTLCSVFAFLFIAMAVRADSYELARTKDQMPGGTRNVLKVFCNPPTSASGCEVIELFAFDGAVDTATVVRVSGCGCITNGVAVMVTPAQAYLTASNTLCQSWSLRDYFLVTGTGTNRFYFGTIQRIHQPKD